MQSLDIILEIGNTTLNNDTKIKLAEKKNIWYVEYISKLTPMRYFTWGYRFFRKH